MMNEDETKSGAPWLPSHNDIWSSMKFRRLVRALAPASAETVFGHLFRLWHSQITSNRTGELPGWTADDLADAANWTLTPPDVFANAMITNGWVHPLERGGFEMHEWASYGGSYLAARAVAAERKRTDRAKKAVEKTGPKPVPGTSQGHPADVTCNIHTEQNIEDIQDTQEGEEEPAAPPPELSPETVPTGTKSAAPAKPPATPARPPETPRPAPIDPPAVEAPPPPPPAAVAAEQRKRDQVVGAAFDDRAKKTSRAELVYGRPQTPEALLELYVDVQAGTACPDGEPSQNAVRLATHWAKRFEALDGRGGRPSVLEVVRVLWDYAEHQRWTLGGANVLAWFAKKLSDDNNKHRKSWEKDFNRPPADVGTADGERGKLWLIWRQHRDAGADVGDFEDWRRKQEEISGGRRGSGSTLVLPKAPDEKGEAAARAFFENANKPKRAGAALGRVVPSIPASARPVDGKPPITPPKEVLTTMLERELGDGADT